MVLNTKQGLEITMRDGATARHTPLKDETVRIGWTVSSDLIQVESYVLSSLGHTWTRHGTPCFYSLAYVKKIEITEDAKDESCPDQLQATSRTAAYIPSFQEEAEVEELAIKIKEKTGVGMKFTESELETLGGILDLAGLSLKRFLLGGLGNTKRNETKDP